MERPSALFVIRVCRLLLLHHHAPLYVKNILIRFDCFSLYKINVLKQFGADSLDCLRVLHLVWLSIE